jgi:hypothetical protein
MRELGTGSVTDVMTANFNKINRIVFNYFKNNPVRIAYRECVILFEIPLQPMGFKSFIEDVFTGGRGSSDR